MATKIHFAGGDRAYVVVTAEPDVVREALAPDLRNGEPFTKLDSTMRTATLVAASAVTHLTP